MKAPGHPSERNFLIYLQDRGEGLVEDRYKVDRKKDTCNNRKGEKSPNREGQKAERKVLSLINGGRIVSNFFVHIAF